MGIKKDIKQYASDVRNLPLWLQYVLAVATIFGTVFGGWGIYIVLQAQGGNESNSESIYGSATSTLEISEIISKAVDLDTVVERQDFLKKYVGSIVRGEGSVNQVSRVGNGFMVDVVINRQMISCPQDESEENEKKLLLLKGKVIQFIGVFTFTEIYGHGLEISNCEMKEMR